MDLQPTLIGEHLLIRPLNADDFEPLYAAASDPLIWDQHPNADRWKKDVFQKLFDNSLSSKGALVVIDKATNVIIGSSRYYDLNDRSIIIGYTFLKRDYWGGNYNTELKNLMISHALKSVDEVHFHVDYLNRRSQKAIEKIGAVKIGQFTREGRTVFVYSIDK